MSASDGFRVYACSLLRVVYGWVWLVNAVALPEALAVAAVAADAVAVAAVSVAVCSCV
jgi:hypothetical protein